MSKIIIPEDILKIISTDLKSSIDALNDAASLTIIKTDEESETAAKTIKIAKEIISEAKKQKKKAEEPFEIARKAADIALTSAKENKKSAGEPFLSIISISEQIELAYRGYISQFLSVKEQERQKLEQERIKAAQEAERLRVEALEAATSEEPEEVQMADFLEEAANAQQQKALVSIPEVKGPVSFRTDIEVVIEDINLVPDAYFIDTVDFTEIYKTITKNFIGLNIKIEEVEIVDKSKVDPNYLIQEIDINKVKLDLKNNETLVIPGIKRDLKHIAIIR